MKKYRLNKQILVNSFSGGCQFCGYNRCLGALAFHHLDPKTKKFSISRFAGNNSLTYEQIRELEGCALLCHNCHSEVHAGMHKDKIKEIDNTEILIGFME